MALFGPPNIEKLKEKRDVDGLARALKNKDDAVRLGAVHALREISDARAVEPLIAALGDKYANVRHNAVEALGELRDPRAVEPLVAAITDNQDDHTPFAAGILPPSFRLE